MKIFFKRLSSRYQMACWRYGAFSNFECPNINHSFMFLLQKLFVFIRLFIIHSRTFSQVMKSFTVTLFWNFSGRPSFEFLFRTYNGTSYGTCYVTCGYYYSGCYFSFANNSWKIQIFKNNTNLVTLYPEFGYQVRYRMPALKCKVHFELSSGRW